MLGAVDATGVATLGWVEGVGLSERHIQAASKARTSATKPSCTRRLGDLEEVAGWFTKNQMRMKFKKSMQIVQSLLSLRSSKGILRNCTKPGSV